MKKVLILSTILSQLSFLAPLPIYLRLFAYLHPVVLVVVWFCQTAFIFLIIFSFYQIKIKLPMDFIKILIALYSIALLILLFMRPTDQDYHSWNLIPFKTILFYLSGSVTPLIAIYNLAANIGLFIPYGIFLKLQNRPIQQLVYFPIIAISLIELTQFMTHRGSLDIDDLILNLIGVWVGYLLYPLFQKVVDVGK